MELETILQMLKDHIVGDEKVFNNISETIKSMKQDICNMRDNHLHHLQEDINELRVNIKELKSDMKWIKAIGSFLIIETLGILIKLLFNF